MDVKGSMAAEEKTGKETGLVILNFFLHPICNTSAELIKNGDDCFSISISTGDYRRIHLDLDSYLDKKGKQTRRHSSEEKKCNWVL